MGIAQPVYHVGKIVLKKVSLTVRYLESRMLLLFLYGSISVTL
jgi:hypothetical protein